MTVLSADRNTPERTGDLAVLDVAAAVKIYAGALVALDADGNATPGTVATTLIGAGRAEEQVDNSAGVAAAKTINVRRGTFRFVNSADADEITKASIGDACYIVDDETVAKTDGGSTRSKAGIVVDVDSLGVWVDFGTGTLNSPASSLLAANNLSDLANAATARGNIGVNAGLGTPTITVGAEAADVINVAIQLKDPPGPISPSARASRPICPTTPTAIPSPRPRRPAAWPSAPMGWLFRSSPARRSTWSARPTATSISTLPRPAPRPGTS